MRRHRTYFQFKIYPPFDLGAVRLEDGDRLNAVVLLSSIDIDSVCSWLFRDHGREGMVVGVERRWV